MFMMAKRMIMIVAMVRLMMMVSFDDNDWYRGNNKYIGDDENGYE